MTNLLPPAPCWLSHGVRPACLHTSARVYITQTLYSATRFPFKMSSERGPSYRLSDRFHHFEPPPPPTASIPVAPSLPRLGTEAALKSADNRQQHRHVRRLIQPIPCSEESCKGNGEASGSRHLETLRTPANHLVASLPRPSNPAHGLWQLTTSRRRFKLRCRRSHNVHKRDRVSNLPIAAYLSPHRQTRTNPNPPPLGRGQGGGRTRTDPTTNERGRGKKHKLKPKTNRRNSTSADCPSVAGKWEEVSNNTQRCN
ncbi:hypothetical protein LZ31DRAFT_388609 [Colletotrichum somersetense]|nr:hypothetical protein LZ31DRAFT_388609 [Colletotrichum somersetense]